MNQNKEKTKKEILLNLEIFLSDFEKDKLDLSDIKDILEMSKCYEMDIIKDKKIFDLLQKLELEYITKRKEVIENQLKEIPNIDSKINISDIEKLTKSLSESKKFIKIDRHEIYNTDEYDLLFFSTLSKIKLEIPKELQLSFLTGLVIENNLNKVKEFDYINMLDLINKDILHFKKHHEE